MARSSAADAVRPLDRIAKLCLALLGAILLGIPILAIALHGDFFFGAWGTDEPCVSTSQSGLTISGSDSTGSNGGDMPHVQPGVRVGTPTEFQLCQQHMGQLTRALVSVPALFDLVWTIGFFVLLLVLTSTARRHGLFTAPVARLTSRLGWYLFAGCLIVSVMHAIGYGAAIHRLAVDYPLPFGILANMHWNWSAIIGGLAAISVGRMMRQAIPLREEVEATV